MYDFETMLLMLALIAKNHPEKKDRKKRCLSLMKKVTPGCAAFIAHEVLVASNFKKCIHDANDRYVEALAASREAVTLGAQGLLIHGDEYIPVYLDICGVASKQQCIEHEETILSMVGREYMYKYSPPHNTLVSVALFSICGFSGQDRMMTLHENRKLFSHSR